MNNQNINIVPKRGTKKTRQMAYAHAVAREKQTQGIPLAHFAEKQ